MGYIRHHAIVVTCWQAKATMLARQQAAKLFPWVSDVSPEAVNEGYQSFFIPPDGSKEGWTESDDGNRLRDEFISWMNKQRKRGIFIDYAEVEFGGDDKERSSVRTRRMMTNE